jgi:hypothetical protein
MYTTPIIVHFLTACNSIFFSSLSFIRIRITVDTTNGANAATIFPSPPAGERSAILGMPVPVGGGFSMKVIPLLEV